MFSVIKYLVIVLTVTAASMWATSIYYNGKIAAIELHDAQQDASNAKADLQQFQITAANINAASQGYIAVSGALNNKLANISKEFRNAKLNAPLPADCVPDADRLRVLSLAVTAANEAASVSSKSSAALPNAPPTP